MPDTFTTYQMIEQTHIVAGMRGAFGPETALRVTEVLMSEGIRVFELTMNSEDPIDAMQAVKKAYGDEAAVGMGTVLDTETAKRVLDAGADFIVSPAFSPAVVQVALDADVLIAPGVATPTEAVNAWEMGVPLLKLFPIGALGIDYFRAMFGPLNHMKFMCNGAMNQENARAFLQAGAVACGMAGWLTGNGTVPLETIRARAHTLVQAVQGKPQTSRA